VSNPRSGPGLRAWKISRRSDVAFLHYGPANLRQPVLCATQKRENMCRVKISKFGRTLLGQFSADLCQIFSVCSRATGLSTEPNRSRICGQSLEIIEAKIHRKRQRRQIPPIFDPPYLRQIWSDSRRSKTLAISSSTSMTRRCPIGGTPPLEGHRARGLGKIFPNFDRDYLRVAFRLFCCSFHFLKGCRRSLKM